MNTYTATHEPDRRIQNRWSLVNYDLLVYSEGSEVPIGQVEDFNAQGMRLITQRPIADAELNSLRIEKPLASGSPESVRLATNKIWSHKKAGNGHTQTGLTFIDPQAAMTFISSLLPQDPRLEFSLKNYHDALGNLDDSISEGSILAVLNSRDALQTALAGSHSRSIKMLLDIFNLDRRLRAHARQIARQCALAEWRKSLNPSENKWWWFLDQGRNWVLGLLSVLLTFFTVAGLAYILPRLFTGGVNGEVALFTMLQTAIVYTGAKGAFTQALPQTIETFFIKIGVPEYHLDRVIFSFTLLAFFIVAGTYLSFPTLATTYHNQGKQNYKTGHFTKAVQYYKKALALVPTNIQIHLDLALLYEDTPDYNAAIEEYRLAANICGNTDTDRCTNVQINMARLTILNGEYEAAIATLKRLKRSATDATVTYYIYKNLGWAVFKQGYLEQAQSYLQASIDCAKSAQPAIHPSIQVSAHCLLAQVSEKLGADRARILPHWEACYQFNQRFLPEEKIWYDMAKGRLFPEHVHSAPDGAQK